MVGKWAVREKIESKPMHKVIGGKKIPSERKCMNCGKEILFEAADLYSRRFCSDYCKEEYLSAERQ